VVNDDRHGLSRRLLRLGLSQSIVPMPSGDAGIPVILLHLSRAGSIGFSHPDSAHRFFLQELIPCMTH
jgi:hypothetical protein